MPGLSKKETARLLTHIEAQGVVTTPVKNGVMLRLPNGESTTVHFSVSDHRGPLNMRAFLKRNGIDWPTDKHDVKVSKATKERGDIVLEKMGNPSTIRAHDFHIAAGLIDWKVSNTTVANYLYSKGYEGVGNTVQRRFVIPDPFVVEAPKLKSDEVSPQSHPIVSIVKTPLPEILTKESTLEVREFLDTHDSWVVNMDILPDTLTVRDMKLVLAALGVSFEVRVWK
jgi:hypothetical protein